MPAGSRFFGAATVNNLDRLQLQRAAKYLYQLGPRGIYEILVEISEALNIVKEVIALFNKWQADCSPELLHAVLTRFAGGREFPPTVILVPRWNGATPDGGRA
jgi:hypothetical protein